MSDISLNAFPQNNIEALAMLYVKAEICLKKRPKKSVRCIGKPITASSVAAEMHIRPLSMRENEDSRNLNHCLG